MAIRGPLHPPADSGGSGGGVSEAFVAAAIADHEAEPDPHPGYLTAAEGNAAYQPLDAELTAVAGLTSAANKLPYFTGSGTAALADLSANMRTFMTTPSAANFATLVTDDAFSLADVELGAIAGLTSAADRLPYFTGSGTAALATYTSAARTFDAAATAQAEAAILDGTLVPVFAFFG